MEGQQWERIADYPAAVDSLVWKVIPPHHDHLMVLSFFLTPRIRWHLENRDMSGILWTDDGRRVNATISHNHL